MAFEVKLIADSVAPCGKRLTTITAKYPRFIHSELLTHRDRARNSASSRAIPWPKMMAAIQDEPVIPIRWGSEQKGMQTGGEIDNPEEATRIWLAARDSAVLTAQLLAELGVHKSLCNRITEPWMWITVVITATEWNNLFRLRCHSDAEIHFQKIAGMIQDALTASSPRELPAGYWHLPFVEDIAADTIAAVDLLQSIDCPPQFRGLDYDEALRRASVARCARVSYLTHEGKRDIAKDLDLYDKLVQGSGFGHWSPHEHVARSEDELVRSGPFIGWTQFRKMQPNENVSG